jgi:hypothetical protein
MPAFLPTRARRKGEIGVYHVIAPISDPYPTGNGANPNHSTRGAGMILPITLLAPVSRVCIYIGLLAGLKALSYTPGDAMFPVSGRAVEDVLVLRGLTTLLYVVISPLFLVDHQLCPL